MPLKSPTKLAPANPTEKTKARPRTKKPRIALALAGGGPLGVSYEIGALCALDEALVGVDFCALDHYVGVSAGGVIAAALANGMRPREVCKSFMDNDGVNAQGVALDAADSHALADRFDPALLMRPAWGEFARRGIMLPGLLIAAVWQATLGGKSIARALETLGPALPTGIFSNETIHERLSDIFSRNGRTNDFRQLTTRLTLVATNLDSGQPVSFGSPGWDHVPISRAVQASSALPGLFPPVEIDAHYYADGALTKTLHASVALDASADLLICLNPLVPFDASAHTDGNAARKAVMRRGLPLEKQFIPRIVDGGLPGVLSQTFRSMIHSRMELGMKHYERSYPHTDIVRIEPDRRDPELYLANTFSYGQRRAMAEHAYQHTRHLLRARKSTLSRTLARHGITLNELVLADPRRQLVLPPAPQSRLGRSIVQLQEVLEDLETSVRVRA